MSSTFEYFTQYQWKVIQVRVPIANRKEMPASDKIFSRGMKAQSPRSRCGNRPGTSKSMDSPVGSNDVLLQRPHSGSRPMFSTSFDSDKHGRPSACSLTRQNAVCVDNDLIGNDTNGSPDMAQFPRPPSHPPSRPRSRKGRPMSVKGHSRSVEYVTATGTDVDKAPLPHPLQSQVSFSKYKPLPSIGFNSSAEGEVESSVSTKPYETRIASDSVNITSQGLSHLSLNQVPEEPPESDQSRVKLAVKLLNGSRYERWFRNTDTLGDVLAFAKCKNNGDLPPCQFCTSEVPRRVFTDMSLTLKKAGIVSRSLLHLEEV